MRVTIACPEALIGDANQLALCLGLGPEDAMTYGDPVWQDGTGALYAVASAMVSNGFVAAAASPLPVPPWGADMAAAARAQAAIAIWQGEDAMPWAAPDRLAAVIGTDPQVALAVLGLTQVEQAA
ncbi:hypothetical protein [Tabrizicola fusiformis]|uniref:hypothetical protein n=1 Tax=Tabrizicola sp. SY72 TaxID=2741673 RepID=UPI001573C805|nr:hypothetical protein [Tabrizicola sp. SY72]NTT88396.1 hypothetical protein [Tabrizicola sp. SY72]